MVHSFGNFLRLSQHVYKWTERALSRLTCFRYPKPHTVMLANIPLLFLALITMAVTVPALTDAEAAAKCDVYDVCCLNFHPEDGGWAGSCHVVRNLTPDGQTGYCD